MQYDFVIKEDGSAFFILSFRPTNTLLNAVRRLPYTYYDPKSRVWEVLATYEVHERLKELGFTPKSIDVLEEFYNYNPERYIQVSQLSGNEFIVKLPLNAIKIREEIKKFSRRRYDKRLNAWRIVITKPEERVKLLNLIPVEHRADVAEIVVFGSTCRIVKPYPLPPNLLIKINSALSFRPKGFEYTKAYQDGLWDGYIHLFNREKQTFPIGMLDVVKGILQNYYDVVIKDFRGVTVGNLNLTLRTALRDYQKLVLHEARRRRSGLIVLPTGAGKTIVAMKLIEEIAKPTIILVHTKELLYQWQKMIRQFLGIEPGLIGDGKYTERDVTVAMLQTLSRRFKAGKYLQKMFDVMIVDEAHHIPADTFYFVASRIDAKWRYGFTATPYREDGKDLMIIAMLGKPIDIVGAQHLIEQGYLAQPVFLFVEYPVDGGIYEYYNWLRFKSKSSMQFYTKYYTRAVVQNNERNKAIVFLAKQFFKWGYRVYIDVKRVKHGQILEQMLRDMSVDAIFISGQSSSERRKAILKAFEIRGNFVLISTLIKEGVDLPSMNVCIYAGAGASSVQAIQTIGRALRPKRDGANVAYIVDFIDRMPNMNEHYKKRFETYANYYKNKFKYVVVRQPYDVSEVVNGNE